jgi:hypothetical protein
MFGLGSSPLTWPLLVVVFAVWFHLYWHELKRNWLSWRAFVVLVAMVLAWACILMYVNSARGFF